MRKQNQRESGVISPMVAPRRTNPLMLISFIVIGDGLWRRAGARFRPGSRQSRVIVKDNDFKVHGQSREQRLEISSRRVRHSAINVSRRRQCLPRYCFLHHASVFRGDGSRGVRCQAERPTVFSARRRACSLRPQASLGWLFVVCCCPQCASFVQAAPRQGWRRSTPPDGCK